MLTGEVGASAGHGSAMLLQSPALGRRVQVSLQVPTLELSRSVTPLSLRWQLGWYRPMPGKGRRNGMGEGF